MEILDGTHARTLYILLSSAKLSWFRPEEYTHRYFEKASEQSSRTGLLRTFSVTKIINMIMIKIVKEIGTGFI